MSPGVRVTLAGEPVDLLGGRALYWPARARLLMADLHLGKADAFRRAGIALPRGGTAHDLGRLDRLIESTGAGSVWVLGDMLHGATDTVGWRQAWEQWRATRPRLDVGVLSGNHDRALPAAALEVRLLGDAVDDGPFAFRHAPQRHGSLHVVCGHLHPVAVVPGIRRRWPAFWLREGVTVLPAFSEFSGGVVVAAGEGETLVACVDGNAIALPGAGSPA